MSSRSYVKRRQKRINRLLRDARRPSPRPRPFLYPAAKSGRALRLGLLLTGRTAAEEGGVFARMSAAIGELAVALGRLGQ